MRRCRRIHVGQTGTLSDPVQKEFTGEIRGLTSIGLSANVTLMEDNDIATMEVTGANGQSTTVGQQVRPAHGSEGTGLSILQQAEHLARAGRQVAEALRGNNPTARLVVAAQGQANIQRERQEALADGTTETVITVTENELEDAAKGVLVAMAGENLFPDVEWATNLKTIQEMINDGEISIPVSMSVAKFLPSGERETNLNNIPTLDPSKPVWVVVHGRANSEESSQIVELAKNFNALGAQVVTVDWHDGADDNLSPIGLEGSRWIENVGTWTANKLQAAGFSSQNICVVGHSWGAYVAYEIGKRIQGGVQTLIALDPAADSELLGGGKYAGFDDPNFSFSSVAANSYAFHSSEFGDKEQALTAEFAFNILAPENYKQNSWDANAAQMLASQHYFTALGIETADELRDAYNEHGFAVSLFSELLRRQKMNPNDAVANRFSLQNLRSNAAEFYVRGNNWEGCFYANPSLTTFASGADSGKQAWIANAYQFYSQDENGSPILGN